MLLCGTDLWCTDDVPFRLTCSGSCMGRYLSKWLWSLEGAVA